MFLGITDSFSLFRDKKALYTVGRRVRFELNPQGAPRQNAGIDTGASGVYVEGVISKVFSKKQGNPGDYLVVTYPNAFDKSHVDEWLFDQEFYGQPGYPEPLMRTVKKKRIRIIDCGSYYKSEEFEVEIQL